MKTSTLGLGVIAAVALTSFAVSAPTYAQQATSDTARPQIEGSREMREVGMKRRYKGHKMGGMNAGKEFFEELSDEQKEQMKTELEALRGETTREEMEAMSEEEREGFHTEMQAQRKEIMEKYVDADDLESGAYSSFQAEQEANHAERKASGEEYGKRGEKMSNEVKRGEKSTKGNVIQKFISYVATMDADQKSELLEKIDGKVGSMMTRIEEGEGTDAEKSTKIDRVKSMVEMIKGFLS